MLKKSSAYKQELKVARKRGKKVFLKKLRELKVTDSKLYWRLISNNKKEDTPILISEFFKHFKDLSLNSQQTDSEPPIFLGPSLDNSALNKVFDEKEIGDCIQSLKNGKSAGIDLIVNEYIKSTKDIMMPLYIKLFNKVLQCGYMPEDWLIGAIIPIYKNKGDKKDVNNYRGITLLSCLGKLFTSALNGRLSKFCEINDIIGEVQAGFR